MILMSKIDTLIGPATISELNKTIAICTQSHHIGLKFISNGCYTDGATIYIAPPPQDVDLVKRWILLEANIIHESWHILFKSDFYLLKEFITHYEKNFIKKIPFIKILAHDIVNIIEDARIEYHGKKRFLGNKDAIIFTNVYWLRKRPSIKGMDDWKKFIEGLLQLAACGGLKEAIKNQKIIFFLNIATFYLEWARIQERSKASFLAAEKIIRLLIENFDLEGNYSQQVNSPPDSIKFEPSSNDQDDNKMNIPELPEDIQKKLDEIKKDKEKSEGTEKSQEENKSDTKSKEKESNEKYQDNKQNMLDKENTSKNQQNDNGKSKLKSKSDTNQKSGSMSREDKENDLNTGSQGDNKKKQENINSKAESEKYSSIDQKGNSDKLESSSQRNSKEKSGQKNQNDFNANSKSKNQSESNQNKTEQKQNPSEIASDIEMSSRIKIVNPDEIDPIKSGIINPADIKIKVDDLTKRNYKLLKDNELAKKANKIVNYIKKLNLFKDVFYTKTYDIGIEIELKTNKKSESQFLSIYKTLYSLIQITINQFKSLFKSGSKTTNKLKFGRLDSRKMVRGLINEDPHIFKKRKLNDGTNEIVIALLIDQSGSMRGAKIKNAQKAAILFGDVLNSLDLNFAIYGWTDINYVDANVIRYLKQKLIEFPKFPKIEFPSELNNEILNVFCYKEFDEPYEKCKEKLALIRALSDNSDHNAFDFISKKLIKTKKRVKILMVLSDGQPAAHCYKYIGNRLKQTGDKKLSVGNIRINMTRQAIDTAQKSGIQPLCISIDSSKNYQEQIYGKNNYIIINPNKINELPVKVARILSLLLRRAGVKF